MIVVVALLLGLVVGSFLNVVIARLPRKESVITPASHCLGCGVPIRWHDNIPLVSFLRLRGRCRACGGLIGWRYPAVEGTTGALFAAAVGRFGVTPALAPALLLVSALVAVTAIDLDHQIIPDRITLPGIVTGFVTSSLTDSVPWSDALIGAVIGGGLFFLIIVLSRGGMGGGDMKLSAMIGAFLGWKLTLVALLLAVLTGGLVGAALLATGRRGRKDAVPFGPFLAFGATAALFWGEGLLGWYLSGFR